MRAETKAAIHMWCFTGLRLIGGFAWGAGFTDGGAYTKTLMGTMAVLYVVGYLTRDAMMRESMKRGITISIDPPSQAELDALWKRLQEERRNAPPRDVN